MNLPFLVLPKKNSIQRLLREKLEHQDDGNNKKNWEHLFAWVLRVLTLYLRISILKFSSATVLETREFSFIIGDRIKSCSWRPKTWAPKSIIKLSVLKSYFISKIKMPDNECTVKFWSKERFLIRACQKHICSAILFNPFEERGKNF